MDEARMNGPFDSEADALEDAKREYPERNQFVVGQGFRVEVDCDAECLIENFSCQEPDILYENALEDWCEKVPRSKMDALSSHLTEILKEHLKEWGEPYEWLVVRERKRVQV